jgi:hypothetical protein
LDGIWVLLRTVRAASVRNMNIVKTASKNISTARARSVKNISTARANSVKNYQQERVQ